MAKKYKKEEVVSGVLDFIKDTGHENVLSEVVTSLDLHAKSKAAAKTVHIFTFLALDEESKDKIKQKVEQMVNHEVAVRETVDKKLLGGIKIKIGDWVYDSSISGQLESIKSKLYENI